MHTANASDIPAKSLPSDIEIKQKINGYVTNEIQERRIPGIQLEVVKGGKIVLLKSYGPAEISNAVGGRGQTGFVAPVSRYLEGLPVTWQVVIVKQLLTHTSGILTSAQATLGSYAVRGRCCVGCDSTLAYGIQDGRALSPQPDQLYLLGKMSDRLSGLPFVGFFSRSVSLP
ncbi:hypothetical protein [Undibacterium sp. RuTC16W]|uniref:hypothetical protein n=1 Tax=Undibacterium sp. RuTC16W TaxID=3413048 RepID=UPI003BF406E7